MPEYLAPGVYVEETSYRSKSIEGVSTTTTGMVGPARYGPDDLVPDLITSLGEFERTYGDGKALAFGNTAKPVANFLWQGVRSFFEEGGKRLYVVRVFRASAGSDGRAHAYLPTNNQSQKNDPGTLTLEARFPGAAGKMRVRLTVALGQNVLGMNEGQTTLGAVQAGDIVWVSKPGAAGKAYRAESYFDQTRAADMVRFSDLTSAPPLTINPGSPPDLVPGTDRVQVVTLKADSTLSYRDVTLGRNLGNEVEVLTGIQAGDTVVLAPNALLGDGNKVHAKALPPAKKS